MTSKSKAWMSPEKTDNVYLLKLQKKKKRKKGGATPSHPTAFSCSLIFIPKLKCAV